MTHTFALLDVSPAAYDEIKQRLLAVGYGDIVMTVDGAEVLDISHVGLAMRALVRRDLVCDCGNRDEDEVPADHRTFPPCSADCGRTMRLREERPYSSDGLVLVAGDTETQAVMDRAALAERCGSKGPTRLNL